MVLKNSRGILRLVTVLLSLIVMVVLVRIRYGVIPFVGQLPGDFELYLPHGTLFLPLATSALVSFLLLFIAVLCSSFSNKI